jgi:hypothetical protein
MEGELRSQRPEAREEAGIRLDGDSRDEEESVMEEPSSLASLKDENA